MARKSFCMLGLIAAAASLQGDWKISTRTTVDGRPSVQTEYFKGGLKRTDYFETGTGRPSSVIVLDLDHLRQMSWDLESRKYAIIWLPRSDRAMAATGPIIVIDRTTTDTGERQTMFGRVARHFVTQETRGSETIEIDGWYIDSETLPRKKRQRGAAVLVNATTRPILKVNQSGPIPVGLAVWERRISTRGIESSEEVTELVEAPLDDSLFQPPPGFKRVLAPVHFDAQFRWVDRLVVGWEWCQDWLSTLFESSTR